EAKCDLEALEAEPNKEPKPMYYPAYDGYCAPRARRRFGLPGCGERHLGRRDLARLAPGRFAYPAQGHRTHQDRGPGEAEEAPGRGGRWAGGFGYLRPGPRGGRHS